MPRSAPPDEAPGPGPVRDDSVTMLCEHCGAGFAVSGRRRYCSNSCRQRSFRARRATTPPPERLKRAPMGSTVYSCPECETRYLGTQRCETCDRFCRRLGAGGLCPCCDEAVAVVDLLGEGVTMIYTG